MGLIRTTGFGWLALAALAGSTVACGGDDSGSGGAGGSAGTGGNGNLPAGCDALVSPSSDDTATVQTALIQIPSGQTLCFDEGTFSFTDELSLTAPNVTLKGVGDAVEDTILDFGGQVSGDDGVVVTADGFTVENFWIKNTPGNGIVVSGSKDVTFRKLKVTWDAGSVVTNGAYSIYPNFSENVLIEDCEVVGAADAGIYVGQGTSAIIRRNRAHGNVAGIEVENSSVSEIYDNEAFDNTVGIFIPVLPNLKQKEGKTHLVRNNKTYDNNHENFAEMGSTIGNVPPGLGILLVAADDVEIRDNEITGNDTAGIGIFSHVTFTLLIPGGMTDPETDGYPERNYIHGNTFSGNGSMPSGVATLFNQTTLEDVIWDGAVKTDAAALEICLGTSDVPTFRMLDVENSFMNQTTDTTAHECTLEPLGGVSF